MKIDKQSAFWKAITLGLSLIVAFNLSCVTGPLVQGPISKADHYSIQTDFSFTSAESKSNPLPIGSHQVPEAADQLESVDNFDDNSDKSFCHSLLSNGFVECSGKSLLQHLKHSIEIRPEISLFILHHSWKSFLL